MKEPCLGSQERGEVKDLMQRKEKIMNLAKTNK